MKKISGIIGGVAGAIAGCISALIVTVLSTIKKPEEFQEIPTENVEKKK